MKLKQGMRWTTARYTRNQRAGFESQPAAEATITALDPHPNNSHIEQLLMTHARLLQLNATRLAS